MNLPALPPLIALFGPTAVGKSAAAIAICEAIGGEIVTADSRQVYRHMDIGTDKPSAADRQRVPHHMIDLVEPDAPYTLALYQLEARAVIKGVLARGKVPVLAGGTPLYVNAVVEGWTIPRIEPDVELRASLEQDALAGGPERLHNKLKQLDAVAAASILPTNTRRIIRALEVTISTGRPISEQQRKEPPPYNILNIGLQCERQELYRRIDLRVAMQFERGLVAEVEALHARGYSFDLPSLSGIGYRQTGDYLRGRSTLSETIQRIKWDTHAFVRHQQNWFRRLPHAHWIDVTQADPRPEAIRLAAGRVATSRPPESH